jgi:hypothetical protein
MRPWERLEMSRATWYRHGKPKKKPRRPKTQRDLARERGVSLRTVQRRAAALNRRRQAASQAPATRGE